jgi:DNA-binding MarR family transcriptional regulator
MGERDELIARILETQQEMQRLFANDRANPIFSLHLTLPQLKTLMLLSRTGSASGQELSGALGVSLATMTGVVDRLVAQDLVTRREDPADRRVRRVELSQTGRELVESIVNAGAAQLQRILSQLSDDDLEILDRAGHLIVDAVIAERGSRI